MKILLINQSWFTIPLREAGHEVLSCGIRGEVVDIKLEAPAIPWEYVRSKLPAEFEPDVVVFLDESFPCPITGIEDLAIPTIFYGVDTHHHFDLHRYMHEMFDATLIAQADYIPAFEQAGCKVEWMPLWSSQNIDPAPEKKYGAIFVGTLNEKLNPDRVKFFRELEKKVEITVISGNWMHLFPHARIVVNQTVKGDLNFRVFEAMMSGALLLTEESANGLTELFTPGKHLLTYRKGDVDQAAEIIRECLAKPEWAAAIAAAGRAEILRAHTEKIRSQTLLEVIQRTVKRNSRIRHFSAMINSAVVSRRTSAVDTATEKRSLLAAMRTAELALSDREPGNDDIFTNFLRSSIKYDLLMNSEAGFDLLLKMTEGYPDSLVLQLGAIRALLNRGRIAEASERAQHLGLENVKVAFKAAEDLCQNLLKDDLLVL